MSFLSPQRLFRDHEHASELQLKRCIIQNIDQNHRLLPPKYDYKTIVMCLLCIFCMIKHYFATKKMQKMYALFCKRIMCFLFIIRQGISHSLFAAWIHAGGARYLLRRQLVSAPKWECNASLDKDLVGSCDAWTCQSIPCYKCVLKRDSGPEGGGDGAREGDWEGEEGVGERVQIIFCTVEALILTHGK